MRPVAHIVHKFLPNHEFLYDSISIGTSGRMKAVSTSTPDRQTKLATYAARCSENPLPMYLRTQKKVQKDVSLFDPIGGDKDGQSLQISDLLQTDDDAPITTIEHNERKERLYRHLGKLDGRELEIIKRRYGLLDATPMTQKAIA
mgnify:CR=1 FL=1